MIKSEFLKRLLSSIIIIPLFLFFIIKGSYYFTFFIIFVLLVCIYEWIKLASNSLFLIPGLLIIKLSFFSAYLLRGNLENGLVEFLTVILICVSTDIGGYFFGKLLKGPKLTKISPNKTYAGFLGGIFLSIILVIFLSQNLSIKNFYVFKMNIYSLENYIFIILVSITSQIGDILISFFKRMAKVKNTGKIIPGHGGLLDRLDGMILAVPFAYLYLNL
tara:strand:+ start:504 stop:1157 length:654 start_codon:yes stop_codon:yes gene_type:complete